MAAVECAYTTFAPCYLNEDGEYRPLSYPESGRTPVL
jgi:hypothetical protein